KMRPYLLLAKDEPELLYNNIYIIYNEIYLQIFLSLGMMNEGGEKKLLVLDSVRFLPLVGKLFFC
ncbi:MAG: hypothetical protein IKT76_06085, partial [Bacteroides sp.]|nr:hypothetical protein [Bacteroides sp.]